MPRAPADGMALGRPKGQEEKRGCGQWEHGETVELPEQ